MIVIDSSNVNVAFESFFDIIIHVNDIMIGALMVVPQLAHEKTSCEGLTKAL